MADGKAFKPEDVGNLGQTLQKLLPVEVTGTYLVLHGIFNSSQAPHPNDIYMLLGSAVLLAIAFFFILATPFFNVASSVHRYFYCGCFLVWALSIEADKIGQVYHNYTNLPRLIAVLVVLVSFVVPYFLPKIAAEKLVQK